MDPSNISSVHLSAKALEFEGIVRISGNLYISYDIHGKVVKLSTNIFFWDSDRKNYSMRQECWLKTKLVKQEIQGFHNLSRSH